MIHATHASPSSEASSKSLHTAIREWQSFLDSSQILQGEDAHAAYGSDTSGIERHIAAALRITNVADLPEVMRVARRNCVAVYPISTGRNWGYGTSLPVRSDSVILDLSSLNRILDFDAELGVITVEPGVTQGMLAEFLDAHDHPFLVPVTGAGPQCSLLGNALERGYGITPHADHWGAVTDLEAVLADGSIYRTALREIAGEDLARLFKWGIGPHSAGLFTQSGFGIVTRMSIVLARRPECVKVCFFGVNDDRLLESTVERIRRILRMLPGIVGGINLMNQHRVLAMSAPYPVDRIGSDGLIPKEVIYELGRQYQVAPWTGFITLYGTRRTVAAAEKEIRRALSGIAGRMHMFTPSGAATLAKLTRWIPGRVGQRLSSTAAMLGKSLELVNGRPNETALPLAYWRQALPVRGTFRDPSRDGCGLRWYAPLVPMRAEQVRTYVDMVTRITANHSIEPLITFTSINDRLFDSTVPILFDRDNKLQLISANACYNELLSTGRLNGVFPYRVGIDSMDSLSGMHTSSREFHARLRHGLDPHNIMAPGRYQ